MKNLALILLFSVFVFSGCNSSPAVSNSANAVQNLSPTDTMKALNEAAKTKDTAKIRSLISKGTLDLLEDSAKEQTTTVDALLQEDGGAPFQELPEMRNEKIAGETATVEIHNTDNGEWQRLPFVKENGAWKVALDKLMADTLEKARADIQNTNSSPTNAAKNQKAK